MLTYICYACGFVIKEESVNVCPKCHKSFIRKIKTSYVDNFMLIENGYLQSALVGMGICNKCDKILSRSWDIKELFHKEFEHNNKFHKSMCYSKTFKIKVNEKTNITIKI